MSIRACMWLYLSLSLVIYCRSLSEITLESAFACRTTNKIFLSLCLFLFACSLLISFCLIIYDSHSSLKVPLCPLHHLHFSKKNVKLLTSFIFFIFAFLPSSSTLYFLLCVLYLNITLRWQKIKWKKILKDKMPFLSLIFLSHFHFSFLMQIGNVNPLKKFCWIQWLHLRG